MTSKSAMARRAAVLALALMVVAASAGAVAKPGVITDIAGTYSLTKRVMVDGTTISSPQIMALYTLKGGRGNFNLFLRNKDGSLASESTISRYTLDARQYCEWMLFTTRDNLDGPGFTHEPPPVENHCSPITHRAGRLEYAPAGESVTVSFGPEGFTANIAGQFTDTWARVR